MSTGSAAEPGPILFAYDGSDLAGNAIAEAGQQLRPGRDALVLTIWEPFNVGFLPVGGMGFDAAGADEVRRAAEETAARGASLAQAAGFRAKGITAEAAPTSNGIIDAAEQHDASLIVLGSHGRSGVTSLMVGSVAGAVAAHSRRSVLVVHRRRASDRLWPPCRPHDPVAGCGASRRARRTPRRPRKAAMTIDRYATYAMSWRGVGESL